MAKKHKYQTIIERLSPKTLDSSFFDDRITKALNDGWQLVGNQTSEIQQIEGTAVLYIVSQSLVKVVEV